MNVRHVCVVTGRASEDKRGVCLCVCVLTRRNSQGETRVYVVMEETEKMRRVCVVREEILNVSHGHVVTGRRYEC